MSSPACGLLSKKGKLAANVIVCGTALVLFYCYFLSEGPMYWVATRTADAHGRHSFAIAFVLSFLPIATIQWVTIFLIDRYMTQRDSE
jgi:O-antigen/teichoic acid export membrane protein